MVGGTAAAVAQRRRRHRRNVAPGLRHVPAVIRRNFTCALCEGDVQGLCVVCDALGLLLLGGATPRRRAEGARKRRRRVGGGLVAAPEQSAVGDRCVLAP